jgi:type III pantothenate kinase
VLLAIDIGNTEATIGLFDGDRLLHTVRLAVAEPRSEEEIERAVRAALGAAGALTAAAVASVVPAATARFAGAARRLTGADPLRITPSLETGLTMEYRDPQGLGADRLANAVAAATLYGAPAIVVDLGTATKLEVVSADGRYRGGAIAPGIRTGADELIRRAARLGPFPLEPPERAVGRSTEECLRSGVLLGAAGLIDSLVRRMAAEEGIPAEATATGGLASLVAPLCETVRRVEPALTLHGIRLLHERNAGQSA